MGDIVEAEGNFKAAESYLVKAYALAKKEDNKRFIFDCGYFLAEIYVKEKKLNDAQRLLNECEKYITTDTPFNTEVLRVYATFSDVYSKLRNFERQPIIRKNTSY